MECSLPSQILCLLLLDLDDHLVMHTLEQHLPLVLDLALFPRCSERADECFHCLCERVGRGDIVMSMGRVEGIANVTWDKRIPSALHPHLRSSLSTQGTHLASSLPSSLA